MPLFAVIALDRPGAEAKRLAARADHFAYVETILDRIAIAGPLRDAAGGFVGSILVYDVADEAEARALLAGDPYFAAGIWDDPAIHRFTAAAGAWIGGKTW
jgi:uncharacterized protein YciI